MTHTQSPSILLKGLLLCTPFALLAPLSLFAQTTTHTGEIQYASLTDQTSTNLLITYKGPSGERRFLCPTSNPTLCESETRTTLMPPLLGRTEYPRNPQGTFAVREFSLGQQSYYILYTFEGGTLKINRSIPYTKRGATTFFSTDGMHIIFMHGGSATRYSIASGALGREVALGQSTLPLRTISSRGRYLGTYNYSDSGHRIYDLESGTRITLKNNTPSYMEFSGDEKRIAYATSHNGFKTLFTAELSSGTLGERVQVSADNSVVEDYLFVGDTLLYLANETHPLLWSLFSYNARGKKEVVEREASYGDYMKRIGDSLAYLKVDGKNSHLNLYTPKTGERKVFAPVASSPTSEDITRETKKVAGAHGVLLSPKNKKGDALFIWLHGGPQRQTSIGFHPYLSYAVYDELLEDISESGKYVYKLDYTGSWGYGDTFLGALHQQVGIVDSQNVRDVARALQAELGVSKVYLIGNSYGGYLSLKALADEPALFSGSVAINAVSNWYGLIGRIPSSPFARLFEGVPDLHNLASYFRAEVFSGLRNVGNQPILVIYGEEDKTVPTEQSIHYVDFAKVQGKNVHLLPLPGEEHIIRTRSSLTKLCESVRGTLSLSTLSCKK